MTHRVIDKDSGRTVREGSRVECMAYAEGKTRVTFSPWCRFIVKEKEA